MKRNKYVNKIKIIICFTCIIFIFSGCQSIKEKSHVIQSQMTTSETGECEADSDAHKEPEQIELNDDSVTFEMQVTEEHSNEERNTKNKAEDDQIADADTTESSEEKADLDDEFYQIKYGEIIDRYIELNGKELKYGDLGYYDFPYEAADNVNVRYNVLLVYGKLDDVGFAIDDLDGNGIKELILADMKSSLIYDIYTMDGETPKLVAASWDRSDTNYCGDHFYRIGSGGAANAITSYDIYQGGEMCSKFYIYTDLLDNGEVGLFFTTNSVMDKYTDELLSQSEYDSIQEEAQAGERVYPGLTPIVE